MISKFTLLVHLFLASVALAVPSSLLEARLARRGENRRTKLFNQGDAHSGAASDTEYNTDWAGAALAESQGTFTTVTGTFTVPTPTGSDGSAAAWVGIDGYSCQSAILQTGVDFTISGGEVSYDAWYEWFPDYAYNFDGMTISAGDEIRATVNASSTTSGTATLENLTTGQQVSEQLSSSYPLCEQDAEWIVEDFEQNGSQVPFADFGTVTFTSATASGSSGSSYNPSSATVVDIEQNNDVLTSTSISGDTVTIKYV